MSVTTEDGLEVESIEDLARERGYTTKADVAEATGLSLPTLRELYRGTPRKRTGKVVGKLADGLDVQREVVVKLMEQSGALK